MWFRGSVISLAGGLGRNRYAEMQANGSTEVHPSRERLRDLMAGASTFTFSAHEDFGIIVPEVQATGTPAVALAAGRGP